jgi:hypothetical protein
MHRSALQKTVRRRTTLLSAMGREIGGFNHQIWYNNGTINGEKNLEFIYRAICFDLKGYRLTGHERSQSKLMLLKLSDITFKFQSSQIRPDSFFVLTDDRIGRS